VVDGSSVGNLRAVEEYHKCSCSQESLSLSRLTFRFPTAASDKIETNHSFSATLQSLLSTKLQNADSQLDVTSLDFSFIFWSIPRNAFFDSLKRFSLFFFRVLWRLSAFFCFKELRSVTSFFRD